MSLDSSIGNGHPSRDTPNAHPYAIKTTSTALLTRSNSAHATQGGRHYYVPLASPVSGGSNSSSSSRSGSRDSNKGSNKGSRSRSGSEAGSGEDGGGNKNGYRGHRYSRSLGSDYTPAPYASAPSPVPVPIASRRNTFSELLSTITSWPDLPDSPKTWTPAQLAAYLAPYPAAAAWVSARGLGGRAFVRIENVDLDPAIPEPMRTTLLTIASALRTAALKGRIYIDSSSLAPSLILPSSSHPHPRLSTEPESPAENFFSPTSFSPAPSPYAVLAQETLPTPVEDFAPNRAERKRAGYASLSRAGARNLGLSGVGGGAGSVGKSRRGKVRGLVDSWERSASESEGESASESESGMEGGAPRQRRRERVVNLTSPAPTAANLLLATPVEGDNDSEPSMDTLLASDSASWGARAWEEDLGAGETVKRVPAAPSAAAPVLLPFVAGTNASTARSVRIKGSLRGTRGREGARRVVTAIFAAEPTSYDDEAVASEEKENDEASASVVAPSQDTVVEEVDGEEDGPGSTYVLVEAEDAIAVPAEIAEASEAPGDHDLGALIGRSYSLEALLEAGLAHQAQAAATALDTVASAEPAPATGTHQDQEADNSLEASLEASLVHQTTPAAVLLAADFLNIALPAVPATDGGLEVQDQDDEIRALRASLDETRRAVDVLRRRLEEVERRVARGEELSQALRTTTTASGLSKRAVARALAWVFPARAQPSGHANVVEGDSRSGTGKGRGDDPPVSALPGYVLLVSLGMCAVVLRVVLRRVARGKVLGLGA
ncbi:hypothetical protein FIBSPDRAFT_946455 [Athelia psychrophila]|uniref:Uncharacterized protein n=1 Tax=Athelia psychrophila TaxID=1759441 RepID=A0A166SXM0_9AGAM|nr:hypothetical protein FIBSPDRAFT_946455 [Fibularhizoctonia sp. CBS 109695]